MGIYDRDYARDDSAAKSWRADAPRSRKPWTGFRILVWVSAALFAGAIIALIVAPK